MRIFVPIEDAAVGEDAGLLVPYRCGLACIHGLREPPPRDDGEAGDDAAWRFVMPGGD